MTTEGIKRAIEGRDAWWWESAMSALKAEASSGRVFESYDLTEIYGIDTPDAVERWGALFSAAKTDGLIEFAGYSDARRPSRGGAPTRLWRGRQPK